LAKNNPTYSAKKYSTLAVGATHNKIWVVKPINIKT